MPQLSEVMALWLALRNSQRAQQQNLSVTKDLDGLGLKKGLGMCTSAPPFIAPSSR